MRPSKHEGVGVFADRKFETGETIAPVTGNIIHWQTVNSIGGIIQDNTFRFSDQYYLSPDGLGNYLNHSCEPNAGIFKQRNRLYLKAIKQIKSGQEIVFDYSTIIGDDDIWTMKCQCGTGSCRKRIKNFGFLNKKIQKKYLDIGAVPIYIINTLK